MPAAEARVPPPPEVSENLPPLDIEPLPKATPKATRVPVPATPTPLPPPAATPSPTQAPRSAQKANSEEGVEDVDPNTRLTGVWRGTHTGHSALLTLREPSRDTGEFQGTLIVQMPSSPVRIAIVGQAFDDGGITIRETKVLQASEDRAWDLGMNTGTFDPEELTLSGEGRDKKGRTYQWSFRR